MDLSLALIALALFSSVHGIVLLGLDGRPVEQIEDMIAQVVSRIA